MFRVFTGLTEQHDWRLARGGRLFRRASWRSACSVVPAPRRAGARGVDRNRGRGGRSGIWATHFVVMLAWEAGFRFTIFRPDDFFRWLPIASLAPDWPSVYGAPAWRAPAGGATIGLGVAFVHYSGMQAVECPVT